MSDRIDYPVARDRASRAQPGAALSQPGPLLPSPGPRCGRHAVAAELRNVVERACVLQEAGLIAPEHLPDRVREARKPTFPGMPLAVPADGAPAGDVREHITSIEREAIIAALDACDGNQTHAARKLRMSRRTLIYKLEKYGLEKKPASQED